ncbi:MAG: hypothetical protein AAF335_00930, partial [Bacteroidota bacterium]
EKQSICMPTVIIHCEGEVTPNKTVLWNSIRMSLLELGILKNYTQYAGVAMNERSEFFKTIKNTPQLATHLQIQWLLNARDCLIHLRKDLLYLNNHKFRKSFGIFEFEVDLLINDELDYKVLLEELKLMYGESKFEYSIYEKLDEKREMDRYLKGEKIEHILYYFLQKTRKAKGMKAKEIIL